MGERRAWFLISKPLRAPFADGSSVLVRTLVEATDPAFPFRYFGDPRTPLRDEGVDVVVPRRAMGHAPSLLAKAGVLAELVRFEHRNRPLHFFFTPNAITSRVLTVLRTLTPRRPVVQSIMSSDRVEAHLPLLRDLDAVVVGSDHTRARLVAAGMPTERVHRIYPGVPLVEFDDRPRDSRALYAGDLDPHTARRLVACARALERPELAAWRLTIACRPKGEGDAEARAWLRSELADLLERGRVELRGQVDDFEGLLRACRFQLYLADHVRKKVDLPLAVLEGMARGLGLVALDFAPLDEVFATAEAHGLDVGERLPVDAPSATLEARFAAILASQGRFERWHTDTRRLVEAEFSAGRLARDHRELYDMLDVRHG